MEQVKIFAFPQNIGTLDAAYYAEQVVNKWLKENIDKSYIIIRIGDPVGIVDISGTHIQILVHYKIQNER